MVRNVKQTAHGRSPSASPGPAESDRTPERPSAGVSYFEIQGQEYAVVSRPVETVTTALTIAEIAVASLIAAGHSNERIAELRGTTTRTVANQVASLLRKLEVPSRHHIARKLGSS